MAILGEIGTLAVIWANAITVLLVFAAIVLKATHPGFTNAQSRADAPRAAAESEAAGD